MSALLITPISGIRKKTQRIFASALRGPSFTFHSRVVALTSESPSLRQPEAARFPTQSHFVDEEDMALFNFELRVKLANGSEEKIVVQAKNRQNAEEMAEAQTGGQVKGGRQLPGVVYPR